MYVYCTIIKQDNQINVMKLLNRSTKLINMPLVDRESFRYKRIRAPSLFVSIYLVDKWIELKTRTIAKSYFFIANIKIMLRNLSKIGRKQ